MSDYSSSCQRRQSSAWTAINNFDLTVLEVGSAIKKMFSLQTFMRRHGLQPKCSVHCYQPSDEQSFCLFSGLFEGQWVFRATEGQQHLKRLQMENKVETAAGVLRISIKQKKKLNFFHFLLFSLREGTIRVFFFNQFDIILPLSIISSTINTTAAKWIVGIVNFNQYTSNNCWRSDNFNIVNT